MKQKVIAVDVDDVCADFIPAWLNLYNNEFDDGLIPEDITEWDISKFVVRSCGQKIYNYLDLSMLYQHIKPIDGALDSIDALRKMGYRIVFVTSSNIAQNGQKLKWLQQNNFLPQERYSKDYIEATDKSLIRCNTIIDDKPENCDHPIALGLLFDRPHNRRFDTDGYENIQRVYGWYDTIKFIKNLSDLERRITSYGR